MIIDTFFTFKTTKHMIYFNECSTIEEVKAKYKTLAKEHHPDRGGNTAIMQAINGEYAYAIAALANGQNFTKEEVNNIIFDNERYRAAIEAIISLPGLFIELVGSWIWVTGDTKPVKKILNDAGYLWAPKKLAWFFRTSEHKMSFKRHESSLDDIRYKYGSQTVNGNYKARPALA